MKVIPFEKLLRALEASASTSAVTNSLQAAQRVAEKDGLDTRSYLNALIELTNVARHEGNDPVRIAAFEELVRSADAQGDAAFALQALLGLALSHVDAGEFEAAARTYRACVSRAEKLGDVTTLASVERNFGIFLYEAGDRAQASRVLLAALENARKGSDRALLGRCLVALGIYHQHGAELEKALPYFAEALGVLPRMHPDALCARSHSYAVLKEGECDCGDMDRAMSEALLEVVKSSCPTIELAELAYVTEGEGADAHGAMHVSFAKKPSESERMELDRVLRAALKELQQHAEQL